MITIMKVGMVIMMVGINHEREFPIPGIPGNIGLQFPSRKSGMEFSTPNPVPENGNGIFHSHSRSWKWEWNFMEFSFPFPLPGMEHQSREKYLFFRDILYFRQRLRITLELSKQMDVIPWYLKWIGWMDLLVVLKYTSPYCATKPPKTDVTPWCNNWDGLD